jgi:hypothetical protein
MTGSAAASTSLAAHPLGKAQIHHKPTAGDALECALLQLVQPAAVMSMATPAEALPVRRYYSTSSQRHSVVAAPADASGLRCLLCVLALQCPD